MRPTAATNSLKVDKRLSAVAAEFSKRLKAYGGSLAELHVAGGTIAAKWASQRCDMVEGEVIDLLLSLNRGHPGKIAEPIRAERTCEKTTRTFSTTGQRFELYRAGQINDLEVLRGLK